MLIILDLDGTIINSQLQHLNAFTKAIKKITGKYDEKIVGTIKEMFGIPGDKILKKLFPKMDESKIEEIRKEVRKVLFEEEINNITVSDTAKDFLERTHKKHTITLATSASLDFAELMLKKFNLLKYFKIIITREDVVNPKPDPELIFKVLSKTKMDKDEVLSIGDSIYDFEAARSAGVKFIGVLQYSFFREKLLKVATCVEDFSEIII